MAPAGALQRAPGSGADQASRRRRGSHSLAAATRSRQASTRRPAKPSVVSRKRCGIAARRVRGGSRRCLTGEARRCCPTSRCVPVGAAAQRQLAVNVTGDTFYALALIGFENLTTPYVIQELNVSQLVTIPLFRRCPTPAERSAGVQ
ncbi:hypothetical protein ZWY2020_039821 [Hordeum vulgare]|nr:hypothetical protein ZWY2020_039821 [Hordeum vulgare]